MQGKPHRVLVDLARLIATWTRLVARVACQRLANPKNLPSIETTMTTSTSPTNRSLGDSGIETGSRDVTDIGHRLRQHDVVDHDLGGGRRDQLQERCQREPHERQRKRHSMTRQDLVKLAIEPSQRAMLTGLGPDRALRQSRRAGSIPAQIVAESEVGWQSVDAMMTKDLLD